MKDSTKKQVEGKFHETKGKVKEATGKITDNPRLAMEGQDEKFIGKAEGKVGKLKKTTTKK